MIYQVIIRCSRASNDNQARWHNLIQMQQM
jgi:hypothetical protein